MAKKIKAKLGLFKNKSPIFVDIGANIASLSLIIAASGYEVWAVEPLAMNVNLVRVFYFWFMENNSVIIIFCE